MNANLDVVFVPAKVRFLFNFRQENKIMGKEILKIFHGETYATADGEEFSIMDLDSKSGYALIENSDGREGVMGIGNMLQAIQSGALVNVEEEREKVDLASDAGE